MLVYFDKTVHMRIMVDASPVGLGAVPMQEIRAQSRAFNAMPEEALVTLNDDIAKSKKKLWYLHGPAKGFICHLSSI